MPLEMANCSGSEWQNAKNGLLAVHFVTLTFVMSAGIFGLTKFHILINELWTHSIANTPPPALLNGVLNVPVGAAKLQASCVSPFHAIPWYEHVAFAKVQLFVVCVVMAL